MATSYAVRSSVRVNGVTYRSPTEAFVAADQIEHDANERAAQYRRNGDDALADRTEDRGREQAETLRTWGRQREEFEAAGVAQPPDRPARSKSSSGGSPSRTAARTPASRTHARGAGRNLFGGRSRSIARRGYQRSGAQAQLRSAGDLGYYVAGATIGIALLTLFLTKRGTGAFADLAGFGATALRLVVDPVDPLQPHLLDSYIAQAQATNTPAVPPPSSPAARAAAANLAARRVAVTRRTSSRVG